MTRAFPGVLANDGIDLMLRPGEIHALLGENGAGKSTLVKLIYGVLKPDLGQVFWKGESVTIPSPSVARQLGIAMVFQHFSLFDSLTVFENIVLGLENVSDRANLENRIVDISVRYGLPLDPGRHVYTLSVGERQRIEIIRCLLQNPSLLIMDEPTSVLTPQEVTRLFETLRGLCSEGMAILYISHKLDEIKSLCEHATILRGGKVVASVEVFGESPNSLAAKMIGQELTISKKSSDQTAGKTLLSVQNLNVPATDQFSVTLKKINFEVCRGEIFGIAGVAGNGQDALLLALNGEETSSPASAITIDGTSCANLGPARRRILGLASIPSDRLGHGAVPAMSLVENTLLTAYERLHLIQYGFINFEKCEIFSNKVVRDYDVKLSSVHAEANSLSGGNLQKFIVGREINQSPLVLVVSQPTWGVDAGAAQAIHVALRELANKGAAILVISQDLDELMYISDRIAAICAGSLSRSAPTSDITIEQIGLIMAGVDLSENAVAA